MTTNGENVKSGSAGPMVQFAYCVSNGNRRNSAPIIIKPPPDFSAKEKHLNFLSLSSNFPETLSPEEITSPTCFETKKLSRSPGSLRSNSSQSNNKSPIKSPTYQQQQQQQQRTYGSAKSPKSPKSSNHFKFPPKKIADKIDEYAVYENFSGYQPVSPTNVNYVPTSPQRKSRTSSRQSNSTSSVSGPRGSLSSTASIPRSEVSSATESSIDTTTTSSRCRRSTSDLTDLTEECTTENISLSRPSSPRPRTGSIKGGLAYLASRRGSRDSVASAVSQHSNEDIGPLNFNATPRSRQRRTSNFLELPVPDHFRPRVCSLPEKPYNPRSGDDLYRLRTFSITKGTVINCGDSIINRRSRSNTSVNSAGTRSGVNSTGERSPFEGSCCGSSYNNISTSDAEEDDVSEYRIVLLGDSGVGKTALVNQFMTSEYMNTYDASLDDEFGEKTVSVLLDGEESEMIFIDHPAVEMSVENCLATYAPHACVVVYSVDDKSTFQVAEDILNYLWRENYTHDKSVILVGNKSDLARSRVVSTADGKSLAASRDSKFIETSSGIQHNVDELLVGILKQSRLKETREKKQKRRGSKYGQNGSRIHGSRTSLSLNIARELLQKICLNDSKSKSCENLHIL